MNIIKDLLKVLGVILLIPGMVLSMITAISFIILMLVSVTLCLPGLLLIALMDGSFD